MASYPELIDNILYKDLTKNQNIALVEQVRDGTTLRVRLFMPDGDHQMVNIALAGVKSARVSTKQGESSEPWSEEVKPLPLLSIYILYVDVAPSGKILHRISPSSASC